LAFELFVRDDALGDHQLGEGVSYCQRANHKLFESYSIGFLFRRPLSLRRVFPATVAQLQKVILTRFSGEIGRSWPVGRICEVIGLLCRRTVPRTFSVRENQILKRGPQIPQSDPSATINCAPAPVYDHNHEFLKQNHGRKLCEVMDAEVDISDVIGQGWHTHCGDTEQL